MADTLYQVYQNDQYYLRIRPIFNESPVDDSVDEMVIKLGEEIKKKSLNEISYDSENKCWLYPLSIDLSSQTKGSLQLQVWFSYGDSYYSTPVAKIKFKSSILTKAEVLGL